MRSPSRNPSPPAPRDRASTGIVVAVASLTLLLHVVASGARFSWMWGVHFYGFYPRAVLIAASLVLAAVILLALFRRDMLWRAVERTLSPVLAERRMPAIAALGVAAGTALFWFARIAHTYLGDGDTIVAEIGLSRQLHEREPLASLLQYAVYAVTRRHFHDPARSADLNALDALAPGSVLAGFLFLVVAWFLARELARVCAIKEAREERIITVLLWLVVVSQGYMQLFFGYVENYSFHLVGVLVYLWLALRYLRGVDPLLHLGLATVLCCALHLSSLVLGVPVALLAGFGIARRDQRVRTIRDVGIIAAAGLLVAFGFTRIRPGYDPLSTVLSMVHTAFASEGDRGYTFSSTHYRDFFNEQLLIGPLGSAWFLPAALASLLSPDTRRHPLAWFFLIAGGTVLLAGWLMGDPSLGYARDWDLLSFSGLVLTTAALAFVSLRRSRAAVVAVGLVCAVATSLYHTAPWIALNANDALSLARLKTLPLGLGRTEVVLSTYYRQRGDSQSQRLWLEKAVQVNPYNVNAIYLLGTLDLGAGRYEEAVAAFARVIELRPDKILFRMAIVQGLRALNRLPDAIPHLEVLSRAVPDNFIVHLDYGAALEQVGRVDEARTEFEQGERLCRARIAQHPDEAELLLSHGFVLMRLGRLAEARQQLERAIALEPRSGRAYCLLGNVLRSQGHIPEASRAFQACLALNPTFGGRAEIQDWLDHH